jgi:hypothetical protein
MIVQATLLARERRLALQAVELLGELVHVLERPVHGREADVGDAVDLLEAAQGQLADRRAPDLVLEAVAELGLDVTHGDLEGGHGDLTLVTRPLEAGQQLQPVERLALASRRPARRS